jgi:hypothetical protein
MRKLLHTTGACACARGDGERFVVRDEELTAFLELESAISGAVDARRSFCYGLGLGNGVCLPERENRVS